MDQALLDDVALKNAATPQDMLALLPVTVSIETLEALLQRFSVEQLNAVVSGKTPLTMATVLGRAIWVRKLLQLGCQPGVALAGGVTALHLAAKMKHADVVKELCEGGADPHQPAAAGPSALSLALSEADHASYAVLAKHFIQGHEGDDRQHAEFEVLRAAISRGLPSFLDALLATGDFPVSERAMAYTAREGSGACMEVLLRHGGSANAVERGAQLLPVVVLASALGNAGGLLALLSTAEPVDLEQPCLGLTPLMHSAKEGHLECVKVLLAKGAKPDAERSTNRWTALCFAANKARVLVVEALLAAGADPCHRNEDQSTVLHLTTDNRVIDRLLRAGADPNALDRDLRTPLYRPALVSDYMSVVHLLRYGADVRFANRAHILKAHNDTQRAADMAYVAVTQVPDADNGQPVNVLAWLAESDREGFLKSYQEERDMGMGVRSRVDLMHDLLNRGPLWIPWNTSTHRLFPGNVRSTIVTMLLCRRRTESPLSRLPRDVLLHLCSFIATPSPLWRELARTCNTPAAWEWCKEFTERCWEFDVSSMVPPKVQHLLDLGQCTKHLTGSDFLFQPFYKCTTCKWGEQFGNNLGMCRSCRDTCHRGHDTQVSGFLPAFCDCGEGVRCALDSQWSLLGADSSPAEGSACPDSTATEKEWRYFIAICDFHNPDVFRELRRPERLLHAVPGDLIKVERKKLQEPGLLSEGFLHGELGMWPASRSYVLPLKEFARALEDSVDTGDAGQLRFKRGDLILLCGTWDGNLPENRKAHALFKGRLIRPDGPPFREGWVDQEAVDLVVNFEVFSHVEGAPPSHCGGEHVCGSRAKAGGAVAVNVKRQLCQMWAEGHKLAECRDPGAIVLLERFRAQMRTLLGKREALRMGLMLEIAGMDMAMLYGLLTDYAREQELLRDVIASLQPIADPNAQALCLQARAWLVMSLTRSASPDAIKEWKPMISPEAMARDKTMRAAVLRMAAFTFLDVGASEPEQSLRHCERFAKSLDDIGYPRSHELWLLCMRMTVTTRLALGDDANAFALKEELISVLETAGRPLEQAIEMLDYGRLLLLRGGRPVEASRALQGFIALFRAHPEWSAWTQIVGMAYEAFQYLAKCAKKEWKANERAAAALLDHAHDKREGKEFAATVLGRNLSVKVRLGEAGELELRAVPLGRSVAGTLRVTLVPSGVALPLVPLEAGWKEQRVALPGSREELRGQVACLELLSAADGGDGGGGGGDAIVGRVRVTLFGGKPHMCASHNGDDDGDATAEDSAPPQ